MTRSLFTVEDIDGGYVHYSDRNRDELLGEWIPGTGVVEYVPRVRCDGCKHYNHRLRRCYHDSVLRIVLREPDWYCADHEPKGAP